MARSNTANVANYFTGSNVNLTGYPMTLACWFYPFNLTSTSVLLATSDAAAGSYHALQFDGSNVYGLGDNFIVHDCDATQMSASASAVAAANTWNHAVAVLTSATSRTVYLNGVAGTPNTGNRTPTSQNHLNVGVLQGSGGTFRPIDGRIAEAGFWNVALTAAEVLMLSKGVSPFLVRPNNLLRYFPLIGYGEERCRITRNLLTETGSMARAEHSRVFYPSLPLIGKASSVANKLIVADAGSYSITGTAASLERGFLVAANSGSYAISGTAATLRKNLPLTATGGSYAITGTAASLERGRLVVAAASSYAISGTAATLRKALPLTADGGSYAISGTAASLERGYEVVAGAGSYSIGGTAASLERGYRVVATGGSYEISGTDATLIHGLVGATTLVADPGSYEITGTAGTLSTARLLVAANSNYAITGTPATLTYAPSSVEAPVRGGGWAPIIYLDDKGRPVDLKTYKARTANQAIQAATKAVKELPKDERAEAREALRALREAVAAGVAERVAEESRALALLLGELHGQLTKLEEFARQEALDDEAITILLLVA